MHSISSEVPSVVAPPLPAHPVDACYQLSHRCGTTHCAPPYHHHRPSLGTTTVSPSTTRPSDLLLPPPPLHPLRPAVPPAHEHYPRDIFTHPARQVSPSPQVGRREGSRSVFPSRANTRFPQSLPRLKPCLSSHIPCHVRTLPALPYLWSLKKKLGPEDTGLHLPSRLTSRRLSYACGSPTATSVRGTITPGS
jgi:hypothetical protein